MDFYVGFVDDIETVFVTQLIKLRCIRIMAGADSIEIVLFHQAHIFADMFQRNSRTYIRITVMTVGSAETDFLTVQVYNGIFNADLTETDALTDGFTVSGQRQCIQVRMFCIPECEIRS